MAEHAHGNEHHASGAVDETPVSNSSIVGWGLIMAVVFFGSAAVLSSIFGRITDEEINSKVLSVGSPELVQHRADEAQTLSTYGYNDQQKGLVHVPIQEGMNKVIAEAQQEASAPAAPSSPAPAPGQPAAPAPAPAAVPAAPAGQAAPPAGAIVAPPPAAASAPAAAKGDAAK